MNLEIVRVAYDHPDATKLVARVQEFYVERYGGPDTDPSDPAMFEQPEGLFFVGYLDGTPVATGAWRRSGERALGTQATAEIKRMYVVPEAQRQGLARRMLARVEESAAAAGFEALVLMTGDRQPEAIALYRASGYDDIPGYGHYRDVDLSHAMGKRLI